METRKSRVSSLGRTSRNRTRENASSRQRLSVSSVASRILPSGSVKGQQVIYYQGSRVIKRASDERTKTQTRANVDRRWSAINLVRKELRGWFSCNFQPGEHFRPHLERKRPTCVAFRNSFAAIYCPANHHVSAILRETPPLSSFQSMFIPWYERKNRILNIWRLD